MPQVVAFMGPHEVAVLEREADPLGPGTLRVRTWYSGISAGTELTAYRGSNPYLSRSWDPARRLFTSGSPTVAYPAAGWGYSEVGEVIEVAPEQAGPTSGAGGGVAPGQVVYGIWGHRSEAVVPVDAVRPLDASVHPVVGCFARPGAIALNAVLAAEVHLGDRVVVFGQGVIGLLATALATRSGADVVAVEGLAPRAERARAMGALAVVTPSAEGGAGAAVRDWFRDGADAAIELSGNPGALHEATRAVAVAGTVVAAGFYQGGGEALRLGEEFHHNRVRIVASQISGTPIALGARWDQRRLVSTFMAQVLAGRIDVAGLVTDVVPVSDVAAIYAALDAGDPGILQAVIRFDAAPEEAPYAPPPGSPGSAR